VPEQNPEAVGGQGDQNGRADAAQPGIAPLGGQRLIDAVDQPSQPDQTPDGEDVAGRREVDWKAGEDLNAQQAVDGQRFGQDAEGKRDPRRSKDQNLAGQVFVRDELSSSASKSSAESRLQPGLAGSEVRSRGFSRAWPAARSGVEASAGSGRQRCQDMNASCEQ